MEIKKILVPTELDQLSAKVTTFAVELAEQMKVQEIVLLNTIVPAHTQAFSASGDVFAADGSLANRFNVVLMEKHQGLVEEETKKFSSEKVSLKPIVRFNDSKTDLNGYMKEFEAGLVVCGSRNEHSFLEKLFGSDTGEILRKVDYPMIILKEETDTDKINNILVAIDVNEENQSGLTQIADFASLLKAKMQLLYVIDSDDVSSNEAIEKLRKLATDNKFVNYDINVMSNNSLEDGIHSFVRKYNPDMVAVLSHGKGKIKKLIYGSSTDEIIKETDKPVFVSKIS